MATPEARLADAERAFKLAHQRVEQARAQLSLLRRRKRAAAPPSEMLHSCSFPPSANLSLPSPQADVKLPSPWCTPETHPPAHVADLGSLVAAGNGAEHVTVLPSLLVPCCAHSGTTFLWRCMLYAFHPQRVCGRTTRSPHNPHYASRTDEWSARQCGASRYLLPGLTGNIEGHWDYRKEWFFYGGGGASWMKGWAEYTGVNLPLCYWEPEFQRELRSRPLDDTLAHSRALCSSSSSSSSAGSNSGEGTAAAARCTHRACTPLDLDKVRLSPAYAGEYDRKYKPRWQFQATKALPRVQPSEHSGAIVSDMTPNYLCSPKALRNLAGSIGAPSHFRMLLLTRSTIGMINASYKMFIQWNWVRSSDLQSDVQSQLDQLKRCNKTLYDDPSLLPTLPPQEVLVYFGRCWRGTWRDFVPNAMPYVCVRSWMAAGFQPSQFMLVRQQTLRASKSDTLLSQISNFTGLTYNKEVLRDKEEERNVHCEAPPKPKNIYAARKAANTASTNGKNGAAASSSDVASSNGRGKNGGGRGGYKKRRAEMLTTATAPSDDPVKTRPLVNTHADYTGNDAVRRTQLSGQTLSELTRLAKVHTSLLDGLGLRELV